MSEVKKEFLEQVAALLEQVRKTVKANVNLTMVLYILYEIGRRIVEEEQNGEDRAEYGKQLLQELSGYLTDEFGKGFSADNLKLMRCFYTVYSQDQIWETLFPKSNSLPIETAAQ